ncbi:MAG TPA: hypothetical protein VKU41_09370 [Polyangiaceae bacterium]|nr:hypothetical protein [Polyangiaceae bacterium]
MADEERSVVHLPLVGVDLSKAKRLVAEPFAGVQGGVPLNVAVPLAPTQRTVMSGS